MSVDIGRMRFGPTPWTCSVCGHENPMHMQSCQGCQREPRTTLTDGKQERDEDREHCERLAHASAKRAASEAINTNLRAALKDMIRMLEAVRYTSGLGKNQMKRIERAKALLSVKNPDQQSEKGEN